jgi:hypothetical protein
MIIRRHRIVELASQLNRQPPRLSLAGRALTPGDARRKVEFDNFIGFRVP